jgi:hypothetical protein
MTDKSRIFLFRGCLSGFLIMIPVWAIALYLLLRYVF